MKTKNLLLILISLTIFSCTHTPKPTVKGNDVQKQGLNGPVKYIKTELYKLIPENDTFRIGEKKESTNVDLNSILEFNTLRNLTSMKEFLTNGETIKENKYTYDEQSRLTELREIDNYGNGYYMNYKYRYDAHDSVIEVIISSDFFVRKYNIERNENNFVIKGQLSQNDTVLYTNKAKYDEQNNIIAENEFQATDILTKSTERSFNKKNLVVKEHITYYRVDDTLFSENLYFYDANDKLVLEKRGMNKDSIYLETIYHYHKNGKLKEAVSTPKGDFITTVSREVYNENGNLINRSRIPIDGQSKTSWDYKYKYDSNNNWIEKIGYRNSKPFQIVKRTIEYY